MIQPIILAGGTGSRLWPLSRETFPKQFQKLYGEMTMLQTTIKRLEGLNCLTPIVICNEEHRFIVAEQLKEINQLHDNIILEPFSKNTAPAIALSAFYATRNGENPTLLILAADHIILDIQSFQASIQHALPYIENNKLITFGIIPSSPETGYGYIKCGNYLDESCFKVSQFIEKPNKLIAESFLKDGNYLWNSGMFAFKANDFLSELKKYKQDIFDICRQATNQFKFDLDFIRIDASTFELCPDDSIDYAVMENTNNAIVISMDIGWNDVGSWASLWEVSNKDENGNVINGDALCVDSQNNYIYSETELVTTIGIQDTIIVQTKDAILVTLKNKSQDVKSIVKNLQLRKRSEYKLHREIYRPWGKYDSIDKGNRYQVKRITVRPGEKLSVQMHHHRAEHWIIVSGTAKVSVDGKESLLTENQAVYIPLGSIHFLENPGKIPLELIEIQVGSYLGEDDITRFEDKYGR